MALVKNTHRKDQSKNVFNVYRSIVVYLVSRKSSRIGDADYLDKQTSYQFFCLTNENIRKKFKIGRTREDL